jgi:DNA-binding CsgD family transcriptional regulator
LEGLSGIEVVGPVTPSGCTPSQIGRFLPSILLIDASSVCAQELGDFTSRVSLRLPVVAYALPKGDQTRISDHHGIRDFFELGVTGFVARDAGLDELERTLRAVLDGEISCAPDMMLRLVKSFGRQVRFASRPPVFSKLTSREYEVAVLYAGGLPAKEVAGRLGISRGTVEQHLDHAYRKLKVHCRTDMARLFDAPEI